MPRSKKLPHSATFVPCVVKNRVILNIIKQYRIVIVSRNLIHFDPVFFFLIAKPFFLIVNLRVCTVMSKAVRLFHILSVSLDMFISMKGMDGSDLEN